MNKHNIQVGQKVWVVDRYRRSAKASEPQEVVVTAVGRKYFSLENIRGNFDLETLKLVSQYSSSLTIYLSLQQLEDENEIAELSRSIRASFGQYGNLPFTLDQLRKIAEIINITQ